MAEVKRTVELTANTAEGETTVTLVVQPSGKTLASFTCPTNEAAAELERILGNIGHRFAAAFK